MKLEYIDTELYEDYLFNCMLLEPHLILDIIPQVDVKEWSTKHRQLMHEELKSSLDRYETPDYMLSAQRVNVKTGIEVKYLVPACTDLVTSRWEIYLKEFKDAVQRNFIAKECIRVAGDLHKLSSTDMASKLESLLTSGSSTMVKANVEEIIKDKLDKTKTRDYVSTGIKDLDIALNGGMLGKQLIVLAARPGMGKTAFATSIMLLASKHLGGKKVLFFSLEMSEEEMIGRLLSQYTGYNFRSIEDKTAIDKYPEYLSKIEEFKKLNFEIFDVASLRVSGLRAELRKRKDVGLVIVDYLQLMSPEVTTQNRNNDVAEMSRGAKQIAKECNIPLIMLSQLNRENDRRNANKEGKVSRPILSDLRDSGAIEQDADMIWFIHRDAYFQGNTQGLQEACVDIAKFRNGTPREVPLKFNPACMRFY